MATKNEAELIAYDIAFHLQLFSNTQANINELGKTAQNQIKNFNSLALIAALDFGNFSAFLEQHHRAAQVRLRYLETAVKTPEHSHFLAAGYYQGFISALICGDKVLTDKIRKLTPSVYNPIREYEDDFLFARMLQILSADPMPIADCIPLLEQYNGFLDGEISAQYDVLSALVDVDDDAFAESFENLLIDFEVQQTKKAEREMQESTSFLRRSVFTEGLAILRVADKLGIKTERDYQYCPALCRGVIPKPAESIFV